MSDETLIAKRYKVLSTIGEGGVGQVLKCHDNVLKNVVAVKMLHSHASEYEMARFHREAKATAKLEHPNIVKILDFGQTTEGRPFLVMEFVDGKSLSDIILEEGPLELERSLPIFRQVCLGLQYAHENGVLHRDVKPSNVILRENGKEPVVKICDFGIAKLQSDDQSISHQGAAIGSPPYISPEGVRDGDQVDARSDVYSTGCLIFETLTGKIPFSGDTVVSLMMARLETPAPRLGDKSLKDFPEEVEELVAISLSLKPEDRYQNMFEMGEAIAYLERDIAKPVPRPPEPQHGYPIRFRRRRLRFSPRLLLVSALLVAFGGVIVSRIAQQEVRISALESLGQKKSDPTLTHDDLEAGQAITRLKDDGRYWTTVFGLCTDEQLLKIPYREKITNLKMVADDLTSANIKALLDMPLRGVDFKDSQVNDRTLQTLGSIQSLDYLKLERAKGVSSAGIAYLRNCPRLQVLDLRGTSITDDTMPAIAGIKPLKKLNLEFCSEIEGNNAEVLANLTELNELELSGSGFKPINLAKLQTLKSLKTLIFHSGSITDKDLDAIVAMKLSKLEIGNNLITDAGLIKLAQMKTLNELNVHICKDVTDAGIANFRKLAPRCELETE